MQNFSQYMLTVDELSKLNGQASKDLLSKFDASKLIKLSHIHTAVPPHMVKAYLREKGLDYTCRVVAHINLKGGTGKTTSAITTATRAAQYRK